ncbi:MAG: DUF3488 domain-containing protein, partial [Deltaproteobacteria bacterium]|nr:DUF3488 domain-containing protein [Deltaproteobacteria bacterium]
MNFSTYTIILTCFMASLGIAAASMVESIEVYFIVAASALAIISLPFNLRSRRVVSKAVWNILATLLFAMFVADYTLVTGDLLVVAARFLVIMLALKLFDLATGRDHVILYIIVFFQILGAAVSSSSMAFLLILFLFIAGGIAAMTIFNIKKEWRTVYKEPDEPPGEILGPGIVAFASIAAVCAIIIAFLLFFLMPRGAIGFFERKTANTIRMTGFSGNVDLGEIGAVKTDPAIVMRVEIKGTRPKELLRFRGASFEHYDGRAWHRRLKEKTVPGRGRESVFIVAETTPKLPVIEQTITLEPLESDVLFAASQPIRIEGPFPSVRFDTAGAIYMPSIPYARTGYKAWSQPRAASREEDPPDAAFSNTSFLEADPSGDRIRALAKEITTGVKGRRKAASVESYLRTNLDYSLDPKRTEGKSPLEDFLFFSRQGFCEHYATAMAVLLRSSGIPSRLVTGFAEGEWNGFGNYFIVRQSSAHAWVEAYIAEEGGWITFDPTPDAGFAPPSGIGTPSRLTLYLDMLRYRWNRNVVRFSSEDQHRMAWGLERVARSALQALRESMSFQKKGRSAYSPYLFPVVAAAGLTTILILLLVYRRGVAH